MSLRICLALVALAVALAACGLKGPLRLPEKNQSTTVTPAASPSDAAPVAGEEYASSSSSSSR